MTSSDPASPEQQLRRALADQLTSAGALKDERWRAAFEAVPRHEFVPRYYLATDTGSFDAVDGAAEPTRWLIDNYSDRALAIQLDGDDLRWESTRRQGSPAVGQPTSSSSMPSLMAQMLDALEIRDGHRVLEIGTGTGYNAALLCHRLGDRQVTSVDIDQNLVDHAARHLRGLGYHPTLAVADGLEGWTTNAPYDRIMATCSIRQVPPAWIGQTRADGLILTNLYRELDNGVLVLLTVNHDGSASGRVLTTYGSFMPARGHSTMRSTELLNTALTEPGPATTVTTRLQLSELEPQDFLCFVAMNTDEITMLWRQDSDRGEWQIWLLAADGSWAWQDTAQDSFSVTYGGPGALWDDIESLHRQWTTLGRPDRSRFGLTVTPAGRHSIWIDRPGHHEAPLV